MTCEGEVRVVRGSKKFERVDTAVLAIWLGANGAGALRLSSSLG